MSSRVPVRIALAALIVWLLSDFAPVWAWGSEGHRIVGRIAELHLTPEAAHAVSALLNGARISDNEVANWADEVRHNRSETGPWHFVDIPFGATGYDAGRDCNGEHKGCVVEAIRDNARLLADHEASPQERLEALKFVVHFVGDIHQPLHCAERNGDKGGNLCYVHWPDESKAVKLHVIWDIHLVRKDLHDHGGDVLGYADALNAKQSAEQVQAWQKGSPADWAWESHLIAVTDVYESIPAGGSNTPLSPAYIERGQKIIELQFMRGGARLAKLLNDIFTPTAGGTK